MVSDSVCDLSSKENRSPIMGFHITGRFGDITTSGIGNLEQTVQVRMHAFLSDNSHFSVSQVIGDLVAMDSGSILQYCIITVFCCSLGCVWKMIALYCLQPIFGNFCYVI